MSNRTEHLLLWLDLETTGSSPSDVPLEVGAILTDWDFLPVGNPFHALIPYPKDFYMPYMAPIVQQMHDESGLNADLADPSIRKQFKGEVDEGLFAWINRTVEGYSYVRSVERHVQLAGSGVSHFDSRFVQKHFPSTWMSIKGFDEWTKPTADIGVLRRFFKIANFPELTAPPPGEHIIPHRALDDVKYFIETARWYQETLDSLIGNPKDL